MFKWLFKLFGYVPVEELEELRTIMSSVKTETAEKATVNLDARTLFELLKAEVGKQGLEVDSKRFFDEEGEEVSLEDSCYSKLGNGTTEYAHILMDFPAYHGGPEGHLMVMFVSDHTVEDVRVRTCCWTNTVY